MTIVRMMTEATHSLSFRMHLLKSDTHTHTYMRIHLLHSYANQPVSRCSTLTVIHDTTEREVTKYALQFQHS